MASKQEKVIAVADSSFLIGLCTIEQFLLLGQIVDRVLIAPAVWKEVVEQGEGRPGSDEVKKANFIRKRSPKNRRSVEMFQLFLDPGEAESLVLAQETNCTVFLVDEIRGRKAAEEAGIRVMGVLGFLLAAKKEGCLTEVRPLTDRLKKSGFRLSQVLIDKILREAGEL